MIVSVSEPPPYAHLTLGARKWSLGKGSKTQGTGGWKSETFSLQSDFVPERMLSSRQGAASQAGSGPTVCVASRCRAATDHYDDDSQTICCVRSFQCLQRVSKMLCTSVSIPLEYQLRFVFMSINLPAPPKKNWQQCRNCQEGPSVIWDEEGTSGT